MTWKRERCALSAPVVPCRRATLHIHSCRQLQARPYIARHDAWGLPNLKYAGRRQPEQPAAEPANHRQHQAVQAAAGPARKHSCESRGCPRQQSRYASATLTHADWGALFASRGCLRQALSISSCSIFIQSTNAGGSAVASDTIHREMFNLRAAGKPLVVSMGNYAASGGYYISTPATHIVAQVQRLRQPQRSNLMP